MGRVLVIAYFFPPLGGAGVQRSAKFVRYLPEFGWTPVVIAPNTRSYWLVDESLERDIPDEVVVHRTPSPDGPWIQSKLSRGASEGTRGGGGTSRARRLASFVLLPDAYRPWRPFARRAARRLLDDGGIDVVYTTSSPDTAHLVGLDLKREFRVPWVADFRDPWTRRIAFDPPTAVHRRWHERHEAKVIAGADHIVVTADETRDDFVRRYPSLAAERVSVIPNGFDPDDFPPADEEESWDRFRLVYVGQLTAGRSVAPLLPILDGFFAQCPEARSMTDVRFVGPRELENDALVRDAGLADVVTFESPRPHREATLALRSAHVVLLVEHMSERAGLIAQGKLYECLYAGRPILGVVPPGAVTRLLAETRGGVGVSGAEDGEGVRFLISAYSAWRERRRMPGAPRDTLARFERRSLTRDLAGVFEGVKIHKK